jgi:hypothetical protein
MYLRRCYRQKDGKRHGYWALVESYRSSQGPRLRLVAYLGETDAAGRLAFSKKPPVLPRLLSGNITRTGSTGTAA